MADLSSLSVTSCGGFTWTVTPESWDQAVRVEDMIVADFNCFSCSNITVYTSHIVNRGFYDSECAERPENIRRDLGFQFLPGKGGTGMSCSTEDPSISYDSYQGVGLLS